MASIYWHVAVWRLGLCNDCCLERLVAEKLQTMAGTWTVVGGMIQVAKMETEVDRSAAS